MPVKLVSKSGYFTGKVIPCKYMYCICMAKGEATPSGVYANYTSAANDRTVEIPPTGVSDLVVNFRLQEIPVEIYT